MVAMVNVMLLSKYDSIFEGKGCKVQQLSCRITGWDFSRQLEALFPHKKYQSRIYFPIKVPAQNLRLLVALDDKLSSDEIFNSLKSVGDQMQILYCLQERFAKYQRCNKCFHV